MRIGLISETTPTIGMSEPFRRHRLAARRLAGLTTAGIAGLLLLSGCSSPSSTTELEPMLGDGSVDGFSLSLTTVEFYRYDSSGRPVARAQVHVRNNGDSPKAPVFDWDVWHDGASIPQDFVFRYGDADVTDIMQAYRKPLDAHGESDISYLLVVGGETGELKVRASSFETGDMVTFDAVMSPSDDSGAGDAME